MVVCLVASAVTVTVAFGITAPEESVTVPVISPLPASCARIGPVLATRSATNKLSQRTMGLEELERVMRDASRSIRNDPLVLPVLGYCPWQHPTGLRGWERGKAILALPAKFPF